MKWFFLSMSFAMLLACAPTLPQHASMGGLADTIALAEGAEHRFIETSNTKVHVVRGPFDAPPSEGKRLTSTCIYADALVPTPTGDDRIVLVSKGRLYQMPLQGGAIALLPGTEKNPLQVFRLLGFAKEQGEPRLLVTGKRDTESEALWLVTVGRTALGAVKRIDDTSASKSVQTFFSTYSSRRCVGGGASCLAIQSIYGEFYLDMEPTRGVQIMSPIQQLGTLDVRDVAWVPGSSKEVLWLVPCDEPS
ncbi:MAG TPA: hypothetical protein PK156_36680 [Polyangium sp.]|nr:hypothetical protein [Polyangium sp.]